MTERAFSRLRESLDLIKEETEGEQRHSKTVVGSAIAASTGIAVGYVVWILRSGMLISSMLSSMPAWRIADPLVVLTGRTDEDDEENESLGRIIEGDPEKEPEHEKSKSA